jgi:hypothetical protein
MQLRGAQAGAAGLSIDLVANAICDWKSINISV